MLCNYHRHYQLLQYKTVAYTNYLTHEIQAQDKATEDIQRALALRREVAAVEAALRTLTPAECQLIHMYYGKQYTLQQVADCLLINYRHYSIKTIKRAKQEALRKLAMVIVPDDISTPLKLP